MKISRKNSKLLKAGSIGIIGTFLVKGMNFVSIPIFSRLLSTAEYGDASLYLTYLNIFTVTIGLALHGSVVRGMLEFKEKQKQFLSSVLFLSLLNLLLYLIIGNAFVTPVSGALKMSPVVMNLLFLQAFATFVVNFVSASLIYNYRYKENTLICFGSVFLSVVVSVLFILTIYKKDSYMGRIVGGAIPAIAISFVIAMVILLQGRTLIKKEYWKFSLGMSLPLILHLLANLILAQSDKIMIVHYKGNYENGIYSLVYTVGILLAALIEATNNIWMPWMFRKLEAKDYANIKKSSVWYIWAFNIVTLGVLTLAPEIVKILGPKEYWVGIPCVIPVTLSTYFMFLYTIYVNIEFFKKKTKMISIGTCMAAATNIGLNIYLIPRYGFEAAAYTTLVSYILLFLFHYVISRKMFAPIVYDFGAVIKGMAVIVVYSLGELYLFQFGNEGTLVWYGERAILFVVTAFVVVLLTRKEIKTLLGFFK
ncbi:MAG: oligosaccharide flippase family protein [Lachnospiraceae bacterium]|nr:oligosaccharide flippase family protein [Lachnospiraceae bacterium]